MKKRKSPLGRLLKKPSTFSASIEELQKISMMQGELGKLFPDDQNTIMGGTRLIEEFEETKEADPEKVANFLIPVVSPAVFEPCVSTTQSLSTSSKILTQNSI